MQGYRFLLKDREKKDKEGKNWGTDVSPNQSLKVTISRKSDITEGISYIMITEGISQFFLTFLITYKIFLNIQSKKLKA